MCMYTFNLWPTLGMTKNFFWYEKTMIHLNIVNKHIMFDNLKVTCQSHESIHFHNHNILNITNFFKTSQQVRVKNCNLPITKVSIQLFKRLHLYGWTMACAVFFSIPDASRLRTSTKNVLTNKNCTTLWIAD